MICGNNNQYKITFTLNILLEMIIVMEWNGMIEMHRLHIEHHYYISIIVCTFQEISPALKSDLSVFKGRVIERV